MRKSKPQFDLEGIENVMQNMNEELKKIKGRSVKGLIEAQMYLHQKMESTPPKIPVDTGNLRHSYFATVSKKGTISGEPPTEAQAMISGAKNPALVLGFGANYGLFVHENMEANFKRSGAGPKFFENHLRNSKGNMLFIIRKNTEIR